MHYELALVIVCSVIIFLETAERALGSVARVINVVGSPFSQR
jgi:hypothetical protein